MWWPPRQIFDAGIETGFRVDSEAEIDGGLELELELDLEVEVDMIEVGLKWETRASQPDSRTSP